MRDKSVFFWPRPLLLLCQVFFFLLREGRTCICHCVNMKVRSPLSRVNSFLPSWGIQGSNPGQQVYAKELPPTEPSHQPNSLFSPLDSAYEKEKKNAAFHFPIWLIWFIRLSGCLYFPEDAISPLPSEYASAMSMYHICFIQHLLINTHVGAASLLLQISATRNRSDMLPWVSSGMFRGMVQLNHIAILLFVLDESPCWCPHGYPDF